MDVFPSEEGGIKYCSSSDGIFDGVNEMISLMMSEEFLNDLLMKLTDGAQRKLLSIDYFDYSIDGSCGVEVRYMEMISGEWVEQRMQMPFRSI